MKYKLIASDFDNTLYDEIALSPRALKAIAAYRAAGGKFCIATGRIFPAIRPYISQLGADDEVIACQGSAVYHAGTGEVIDRFALDHDTAVKAASYFEAKGDVCHAYDDAHFHVARENPLSKMYGEYCGLSPAVEGKLISDYIREMPFVNKVIGIVSEDTIDDKVLELRSLIGDRAEVTKSAPMFLEVTSLRAGKGNALVSLARHLSIPISETVAVGDNLNDLSMVEMAGLGCAVENAIPYLKERAGLVLPSVFDDGVATLIERILADEIK
ncbi:MAG: Cof-type HAD-IIB family hydrolase [Clostridia bacterium]|nr:Cof-type HAD-IIB family hydrolase [Clostridia bacterium]